MAATLYTGTLLSNSVSNAVNGVSFQPDWVWVKSRSAATDHKLTDSVRGVTKALVSNSTAAETTDTQGLTAFSSGGFTVGTNTDYNNLAATYVAWQWKAGGTAVSNTAGSITSSVSANPTAGFSVVTYTGTGSNATVGHGLGVAPSMVIVKKRSAAGDQWYVYHASNLSPSSNAGNNRVFLNLTAASNQDIAAWNNTNPTSSVFSIGTSTEVNGSGATFVAYCFAPVAGYSAFGSYTGNGSADGPFVYCGFRPRYILIKCTSAAGTDWFIEDSSRETYNPTGNTLQANTASVEGANSPTLDILSNGFKLRCTYSSYNTNGGTYIYYAVAENPFKYANAR
jgi:Tfp pilus assembly protein FimT